jgi:hypothetical protein
MVPAFSRLIDFRNAQEHAATTKMGGLIIKNFELLPTNQVHVPTWHLEGDAPVPIADEMPSIVETLLQFAETMFVACVDANLPEFPPMLIQHIDKPDLQCPLSYELTFDVSRFSFPKPEGASSKPETSDNID